MHAMSATGSHGFSLMELLVVLVIMALIAAAWPLSGSRLFASQRLRDATQDLLADMRSLRMQARTHGTPTRLQIVNSGLSYTTGETTHNLPPGLILTELAGSGASAVVFFPDGSARGATLRLSSDDHRVEVTVSPLIGAIEAKP